MGRLLTMQRRVAHLQLVLRERNEYIAKQNARLSAHEKKIKELEERGAKPTAEAHT